MANPNGTPTPRGALGLATVRKLAASGARVLILDLPTSAGQDIADWLDVSITAHRCKDQRETRHSSEKTKLSLH